MRRFMAALRAHPWIFAGLLSLVLLIANIIAEPNFGDPSNWPQQLAALAPIAIVAMASTPPIISGGAGPDLSIGPTAVLCNVLLVEVLMQNGIDTAYEALPLLLLFGAAIGAINGFMVAVLRYDGVIATICTTFVVSGIALKVGETTRPAGPGNWTESLGGSVGPVPGAVLLMGAPVLIWVLLGLTSFHRSLYAVGGNRVTAYSAGVDARTLRILTYVLGSVFAVFGGVALTALVQSSQASTSGFYILIGITAVALGGTSLFGGRGGLTGSFFGACALYLMQNLLSALSVPPNWLDVVYGVMLLVGVLIGARIQLSGRFGPGSKPVRP